MAKVVRADFGAKKSKQQPTRDPDKPIPGYVLRLELPFSDPLSLGERAVPGSVAAPRPAPAGPAGGLLEPLIHGRPPPSSSTTGKNNQDPHQLSARNACFPGRCCFFDAVPQS